MKKLLILAFFTYFLLPIHAQITYRFVYDQNGNRTQRTIVLNNLRASTPALTEENRDESFFTENLSGYTIRIYPNPTKGKLSVEILDTENIENGTWTVFNQQGKILFSENAISGINEIDLFSQPKGIYILQIIINEEKSSWKIIKE